METKEHKELIQKSKDLSEQATINIQVGSYQKAQALEMAAQTAALQSIAVSSAAQTALIQIVGMLFIQEYDKKNPKSKN